MKRVEKSYNGLSVTETEHVEQAKARPDRVKVPDRSKTGPRGVGRDRYKRDMSEARRGWPGPGARDRADPGAGQDKRSHNQ